ncbi:hypothetical protein [Xanthomonas arboricola]|uniref:hypothetical protein n=1 Tax=Xanthomonas arboricola TaxID=56448 RepID=UPI0012902666|nr:hypothetical protein [Xanthomonas arboricola]
MEGAEGLNFAGYVYGVLRDKQALREKVASEPVTERHACSSTGMLSGKVICKRSTESAMAVPKVAMATWSGAAGVGHCIVFPQ